jgi:hypothetical protein
MVLMNGLVVWVSLLVGAAAEKVPPDWKVQAQWYRVLPNMTYGQALEIPVARCVVSRLIAMN